MERQNDERYEQEEMKEVKESYDPIKKDFIDEHGDESTMIIESSNTYGLNMGNARYKLVNSMKPKSNPLVRKKSLLRTDIGFRSSGFAQVTVLAAIASLAVLIVCYLVFRF